MGFSMIKAIEDLRERLGDNMVCPNNYSQVIGKLATRKASVH